jgi:hypothetical protein
MSVALEAHLRAQWHEALPRVMRELSITAGAVKLQ